MRNSSSIDIDSSSLDSLKISLGATDKQFIGAYNRALNRTIKKLYRQSLSLFQAQISLTDKKEVERRVKSFLRDKNIRGGVYFSGVTLGSGKVWIGLDPVGVHKLRGKIRAQKAVKQARNPKTGRFMPTRKGARGASFLPRGKGLHAVGFPNSFEGEVKGVNSIWIRNSSGYVHEAKMAINEPMTDAITNHIFSNIGPMFWKYFEQDLRGRVAGNVQ